MSDSESKFQIEVDAETVLERGDTISHAEYGPMHVEQITISAVGKRARLGAELREDGMSIELTEDEIQERWGETLALDPFEHDDGKTRYKKEFASTDNEIEVTLKVAGPENDAEPVMAHLDDQVHRVLQAMETKTPPEDCDAKFEIDWEGIFAEEDT